MFAHYPLSFEYYGNDIENGKIQDVPDLTQNVEKDILAEELKMSCTNVMLQCLDMESRCISYWVQCLRLTAGLQAIFWK